MPGSVRRAALAAGALIVALPTLASSQQATAPGWAHRSGVPPLLCGQRAEVEKMLKEQFGERAMANGLAHTGAVAEVFTSPKGTWTIIATAPNGMSCLIGSGEAWKTTLAADETI
ncbi:MAG: hypothetical protein K2Y27_05405 [Xanthobacteraceae bacterium]|nr:hypothetical protein [Xanthobacteraceae bacterium]